MHSRLNLDLIDFFRGKYSWGKLLRLLEQLPQGSAYWAARLEDEELAEAILAVKGEDELAKDKKQSSPSFTEMTYQNQLLMAVVDRLGSAIACLEALGGVKPTQVKALPRPLTALDKLLVKRETELTRELETEVYAAMERWKKLRG